MLRLAVAVVAIAACAHGSATPAAPSAPDVSSDVLAFLPANSDTVIDLDYRAFRSSPLWEELGAPVTDALKTAMSSVAWRDCVFGDVNALENTTAGFVGDRTVGVLRSREAPHMVACLEAELAKDGAKIVRDRGAVVAWFGTKTFAFAEAGPSAIVMEVGGASGRDLLAADVASGAPLRHVPEFVKRYEAGSRGAAFWMWVRGDSPLIAKLGLQAKSFEGAISVTDKLTATARLDLASSDAAEQLAALLRPQLDTARAMFEKLDVVVDGATLRFDATANVTQLRQLLSLLGVPVSK
jgi:hypothetical protein